MSSRKTKNADRSAQQGNAKSPPNVQMVDPNSLHLHPLADLVGDMDPARFEEFAADIRANGIQNPLILMADGKTIICGRRRRLVALKEQLKQVPCIVRSDLTDPDDLEVIKLLLGDNLHRHHLSKLQQARRHANPFRNRAGRSSGVRAAFAAGL
jgi:ParB-like chromosome segregation protein Spo0J